MAEITRLEYFAGLAMQALISRTDNGKPDHFPDYEQTAYLATYYAQNLCAVLNDEETMEGWEMEMQTAPPPVVK
jgi:hypothetical protein